MCLRQESLKTYGLELTYDNYFVTFFFILSR